MNFRPYDELSYRYHDDEGQNYTSDVSGLNFAGQTAMLWFIVFTIDNKKLLMNYAELRAHTDASSLVYIF